MPDESAHLANDTSKRAAREPRLPCPVCLGVAMKKVTIASDRGRRAGSLVLDHCARCGGVWFDVGEAPRLVRHTPDALRAQIGHRRGAPMPPCHKCRTPLSRDAERCEACGRRNVLQCPVCRCAMERETRGHVTLDACTQCHGVWFDHAELEHLWAASVDRAAARWSERHRGRSMAAGTADAIAEGLVYSPELMFYGAQAVGHAAGAGIEAAGHVAASAGQAVTSGAAAEAATAAVEIAGDAASGVFEVIVEIIASIFD